MALISLLTNKKLLVIKLRDFPKMEGLFITDYSFFNSVRGGLIKQKQTPVTNAIPNSNPAQSSSNSSRNLLANQLPNAQTLQPTSILKTLKPISIKVKSKSKRKRG